MELGRRAQDLECQAKGLGLCPEDAEEPGSVLGQRQNRSEVYSSFRVQRRDWRGQAGRLGDINEALQKSRGNLRGRGHGADPGGVGTGSAQRAEPAGCSGPADPLIPAWMGKAAGAVVWDGASAEGVVRARACSTVEKGFLGGVT